MIKRLLALLAGAALTLEINRRWERRRSRYSPNSWTTNLLGRLNDRLEARR
jgi:hypothetical protein